MCELKESARLKAQSLRHRVVSFVHLGKYLDIRKHDISTDK